MKLTLLTLAAAGYASARFLKPQSMVEADSAAASCVLYDELTGYLLKPLQEPNGYFVNGFRFNFCQQFKIRTDRGANISTYAYKETDATTSPPTGVAYTYGLYPDEIDSVEEENGKPTHISYDFKSQSMCPHDDDEYWETEFEIFCDPAGNLTKELTSDDFKVYENTKDCKLQISATHKAGCPAVDATAIVKYFSEHPWVFGGVLLGVGFAANFFGGLIFKYVFAAVGSTFIFVFTLLLCSLFGMMSPLDNADARKQAGPIFLMVLSFLIATGLAILIAFLSLKLKWFGPSVLGAIVGAVAGFSLYQLLIAGLFASSLVAVIMIAAGSIATTIYTIKYIGVLTVPMICLAGSALIVFGASMFLGGFPTSFTTVTSKEDLLQVSHAGIYYLVAYLLLVCIGFGFQRWRKYHLSFEDDEFMNTEGMHDAYMRAASGDKVATSIQ